ncbi:hypothetical protein QTN47_21600 [Danxiaibacter flavus]|uniref:Beta-lactamase-inhibitor-like PepSY-like domain-containing protein n=1 Tax=Danxiaibacter flavus TaxID=3049108 RepID=A0ABV3ZLZ4_9BACT|nr:hypothetical protein QNM32_21605 [Chitinophagaceae bacterium DXS]
MKKIFLMAVSSLLIMTIAKADPNDKIKQSFNKTFPNAVSVKWNESDAGYLVSFSQAGTLTKVNYDKQGNFVSSLRYYHEKDLPLKIMMALKNKYDGKEIYGATEFTNADQVIYQVTLKDTKYWYIVNSSVDGDLTLQDKYKKSE